MNKTLPGSNAAWLKVNNINIGFLGYILSVKHFISQKNKVDKELYCDYVVCFRDCKEGDGIYDYFDGYEYDNVSVMFLDSHLREEDLANKDDYWFHVAECEIFHEIKEIRDIYRTPSLQSEKHKELTESIRNYVSKYYSAEEEQPRIPYKNNEDAYNSFNAEWSRLIQMTSYNQTETERDLSTLYGKALLAFAKSTESISKGTLSIDTVTELTALIYYYNWKTKDKPFFAINKYLYLSLAVCRRKLGREYEGYAILALRWYLLNMFSIEGLSERITKDIYGFRKITTHLLGSLVGHTLNITSPHEFNDPFDTPILSKYHGKYTGELINKAYKDTLKISCFSKSYHNPLMWAHYADNHKGICIRYHFIDTFKEFTCLKLVGFKEIKYSDEDLAKSGRKSRISVEDAFFLKGKAWEYEKELRFFCFDRNGSGRFDQYGDTTGCIKAVYFGLRCSEADKKAILNILKDCTYTISKIGKDKRIVGTSSVGIRFFQMIENDKKFGTLKAQRLSKRDIEILLL